MPSRSNARSRAPPTPWACPRLGVVQEPSHLHGAEVSADGQARGSAEVVLALELRLEVFAQLARSRVQPHHRVVKRLARGAIPRHGGFSLVGDANARHVGRLRAATRHRGERALHTRQRVGHDLLGVVLAPPAVARGRVGRWGAKGVELLTREGRDGDCFFLGRVNEEKKERAWERKTTATLTPVVDRSVCAPSDVRPP